MQLIVEPDAAKFEPVLAAWDKLCEAESYFVPGSADLRRELRNQKFRLFTVVDQGEVKAVACFVYRPSFRRFEVASHKLFDLPVRELALYGACIPGQADEEAIRKIFNTVTKEGGFDVINLGEIMVDSPLYRAITALGRGYVAWRIMRKTQARWLIQLPKKFDDYLAALRPTTRTHLMRDHRSFERAVPQFKITTCPDGIDEFVHNAEAVSRLTYQWHIGWGINTAQTDHLKWLASDGAFRGYLAFFKGTPCSFGFGELRNGTFSFRYTGYDPAHRSISPGTWIILFIIRDLIENTDCRLFDFGSGADDGYKSRFATISHRCARMHAAPIYRPYSFLIIAFDKSLNLIKNGLMDLLGIVVGSGSLRRRLNKLLRPLGVGSY